MSTRTSPGAAQAFAFYGPDGIEPNTVHTDRVGAMVNAIMTKTPAVVRASATGKEVEDAFEHLLGNLGHVVEVTISMKRSAYQ